MSLSNTEITLRDQFAGNALESIIHLIGIPQDGPDDLWDNEIAVRAYALANAMIQARRKQK